MVGLGKIGLPLAAQFAAKGLSVVGCDVMPGVVASVNRGESHIHEEAGLAEAVAAAVKAGRLSATEDTTEAVAGVGTVVIIVPLMVNGEHSIDYHNIDSATRAIGRGLQPDTLVIYETTLPVGTTRHRLGPMLEEESRLGAGKDFFLAFSPERLYAGRIFQDLKRYPKIVGGVDRQSTARAVAFYRRVLDADVTPVENSETAEFAKLAETTYRDVNIALANELALYGAPRHVDVRQAFDAANTQPFSHIHRPSIGVGGHCIPVYPHFLLADAANGELGLVRRGRAVNDGMAAVSLSMLERELGGLAGKRVLVLGAAYRENVKELAFSTAVPVIKQLQAAGADVLVNDPLFEPGELAGLEARYVDLAGDERVDVDAVIVQAFHDQYRSLDWKRFAGLKVVLDGRGAVDPSRLPQPGTRYIAIGARDGAQRPG